MKKTKVISVRLQSLVSISPKAYVATAFDGSEAIIPKSQVFGRDYAVEKSDAYWISEWILGQKSLQHSKRKMGWYNPATNHVEPCGTTYIETERHVPEPIQADHKPVTELEK